MTINQLGQTKLKRQLYFSLYQLYNDKVLDILDKLKGDTIEESATLTKLHISSYTEAFNDLQSIFNLLINPEARENRHSIIEISLEHTETNESLCNVHCYYFKV